MWDLISLNFLTSHAVLLAGLTAHLGLIFFPIKFKTWQHDLNFALTYVGIQTLCGGLVLIVFPALAGEALISFELIFKLWISLFGISFLWTFLRIPLENSSVEVLSVGREIYPNFDEFFDEDRLQSKSRVGGEMDLDVDKTTFLREYLLRKKIADLGPTTDQF